MVTLSDFPGLRLLRHFRRVSVREAGVMFAAAMIAFPSRIPGTLDGIRTSDVVSVVALLMFAIVTLQGVRPVGAGVALAVTACLSATWLAIDVYNYYAVLGSGRVRMVCVRWILSIFAAYWLSVLMRCTRWRGVVLLGLVVGSFLSLGSVVYDAVLFNPETYAQEGRGTDPVWIDDQYRASGIFSHPNAAAGTILLSVPFILGAIEEHLVRRYAVLLPIVILGGVYSLTSTRGPTAVAACLIIWHLMGRISYRKVSVSLLAVALLMILVAFGWRTRSLSATLLSRRLFDTANIQHGAQERAQTMLMSLEIALRHPLGVGSRYEEMLEQSTGFTATHNGFLQLALLGGIPLSSFVLIRLLRAVGNLRQHPRTTEAWAALYIVGALMFENQFFVPTFSIVTLWLVSYFSNAVRQTGSTANLFR